MNESWFYKLKKSLMKFFSDIRMFPYPGFLILWGDINYKVKGPYMRKILNSIRPGDILLRRFDTYLGSVAIPGYWSHAAHYNGDNNIIHMLGKGITKEDILTFMRCDDIALLRYIGKESITEIIDHAKDEVVRIVSYDYDFDSKKSNTLYCTELISYLYKLDYPDDKILMPDQFLTEPDFDVILPGREGFIKY